MTPRAPALPLDQRRAAILEAAIAVLRDHGQAATTRAIAEAAGVAEGTLFRAFSTKEELVCAALDQATDPTPVLARLDQVEHTLPLQERLVDAVTILQGRYQEVIELMHTMGIVHPPDGSARHAHTPHHPGGHGTEDAADGSDTAGARGPRRWRQPVVEALTALIEPDADQLRVPVAELVDLVGLLTFAGSHPTLTQGRILSPATIVAVLLDGTRKVT